MFQQEIQQTIVLPHVQPEVLSAQEKQQLIDEIQHLLQQHNAVLVAHYYVDADLQRVAEMTGGCVADSLEMARFGSVCDAETIVVAGVRFMGETAKILTPHKRVLLVAEEAECSLDLSCPEKEFVDFCRAHPDREVVVYANTSAAVKAHADWVATSSIAVPLAAALDAEGTKIIWAPDKYLGDYIESQTDIDMVQWHGTCVVHESFRADALQKLRNDMPDAKVLVHPESSPPVVAQADLVGSTTQIIDAVQTMDADTFIVATDNGIFYKLQQVAPEKTFIQAPVLGKSATCHSCAHCPWMAMNSLRLLRDVLVQQQSTVALDDAVITRAQRSIQRMIEFGKSRSLTTARQIG